MSLLDRATGKVGTLIIALLIVLPPLFAAQPFLYNLGDRLFQWVNPVAIDFHARGWRLDPETQRWSFRVSGRKVDQSCEYIPGQMVTALIQATPESVPVKSQITFITDRTDSSRPAGFQDFGRWQIELPAVSPGSLVRIRVKHICPHRRDNPVVTELTPPFQVGVDT
ncbi:hypothetical protein [Aurantimonas sp. VKM B-3413]|uniref:hypothetical protein n=1 Tax=Aurantimonas sp. VKM B-3413 TaxID=2779401 RepID=UPI001E646557|nr:hypothetical protein [Aurantimonas sp. VKM B-3413]MCB8835916.1 hypothetical protein [Aurantimonas sp. VKM B-3413]